MVSRSALLACALVASPIGVGVALSADPSSGTVSKSNPKVQWTGTTSGGFGTTFSQIFVNVTGQQEPCQAPSCDEFALEVADSDDLTVSATAAGSSITYLQVVKPDGSAVYADGIDEEGKEDNTTTLKIKKAPAGSYKVQIAENTLADDSHTAFAQLGATAPAAPKPATSPGPSATPAPSSTPAPSEPAPKAVLTAKAGKVSAKKATRAKGFAITVSTTRPVTDVQAALLKGRKILAKGKLATLTGTAKVKLKLARKVKLKAGSYQLIVNAHDGASTVGTSTKLKARK